jgi:hypothetical protein
MAGTAPLSFAVKAVADAEATLRQIVRDAGEGA